MEDWPTFTICMETLEITEKIGNLAHQWWENSKNWFLMKKNFRKNLDNLDRLLMKQKAYQKQYDKMQIEVWL